MRERMAAAGERHGIALAEIDGALRQARALGDLARTIAHPAIDLAPEDAPGRHAIGGGEFRIERDRLVEQSERLADGLFSSLMEARHAAQIIVIGIEALRRLALRPLDLEPLELRRDRADDALGHLVLELEDVIERAFIALSP